MLASAIRRGGHQTVGLDPQPGADPSGWAEALFRRVGPARHEPVFPALTQVLHPDTPATGDTALQRELNAAREALSEDDK